MLAKKLVEIGFSEKEALLYVALLELGHATANELATQAGLNRATAYMVLENLIARGLVEGRNDAAVAYFVTTGPHRIQSFIEQKKRKAEDELRFLQTFLGDLQSVDELTRGRTEAKFVRGMSGVEYIRKEFKRRYKGLEIRHIFNANLANELFPIKNDEYRKKLQKHSMNMKALVVYNANAKMPDIVKYRGTEYRFVSDKKFPIFCEVLLYGNWFSILDYKDDLLGVVIENAHLVQTFTVMFDHLWAQAGEYMHQHDRGNQKAP